mmetsp:Transcript_26823/g.74909  ORF Transcript_26823/g.74909 Transcript_26823/m.74909 type:complete len:214 (+) Transcript_26823:59-700(+)
MGANVFQTCQPTSTPFRCGVPLASCDRIDPNDPLYLEGDLRGTEAMTNHNLLVACRDGVFEGVVAALNRGADVETRRPFAVTPDGSSLEVKGRGPGLTPLMYAAQGGFVAICKELLRAKADPNAEEIDGLRPLHFAAGAKSFEACELLIKHGAETCAQDDGGNTAFDHFSEVAMKSEIHTWSRLLGQGTMNSTEMSQISKTLTEAQPPKPTTH